MSDFTYTDSQKNIDSSAVRHAYYNTDDKSLVVVMRANGNAYRYDGVPSWVWSTFKGAPSKGTVFATTIKRSYGPSKFLGVGSRLDIREAGVPAANMGSVTPLRKPQQYTTLGNAPVAPGRRAAVGTPKALVDNSTSTSVEALPSVQPRVRKATTSVLFENGGVERSATFNDKSTVDEALAEVSRLASILGVDLKVKAVTVHFE